MCKHCKNNSFVSSVISPLLHDDESLFVPLPLLEMHHVAYVNSFHFDDLNFNGSFLLVFPDRAWRLLSPNLGLTCDHLKTLALHRIPSYWIKKGGYCETKPPQKSQKSENFRHRLHQTIKSPRGDNFQRGNFSFLWIYCTYIETYIFILYTSY